MGDYELRPEHRKPFISFYKHLPSEFLPPELTETPEVSSPLPLRYPVVLTWAPLQDAARKDIINRGISWTATLGKTFPRSDIPPKLTLKSGFSYQPPRFLFGWAMEKAALCAAAEICGFVKEARGNQTLAATVTLKKVLVKKLPKVMDVLGWVVIHPVTVYNLDGKLKTLQCIVLADSWVTGNRKPSAEHIQALREFFHIDEGDIKPVNDEPAWWTDLLAPYWHYDYKRADLEHYRPWDLQPRLKT